MYAAAVIDRHVAILRRDRACRAPLDQLFDVGGRIE
jgi:hypothetical protein